jgi:hypothetical protein
MTSIAFGPIRKPKTSWFGIYSNIRPGRDEAGSELAIIWDLARSIDQSLEWQHWWNPAGIPRLEIRPLFHGRDIPFTARRMGRQLLVQGGTAASSLAMESFDDSPEGVWDKEWVDANQTRIDSATANLKTAVYALILSVSADLGLQHLPGHL